MALTTSYARDVLGRIVGVVDPKLNTWAYSYDGLGRRIAVADPDLGSWTYAYDAASKLVSQQDAKGQITNLTYDALGRVTAKTVSGSGLAVETTLNTYDEPRSGFYNRGKLTSASRTVAAQSVGGASLAQVNVSRTYDYDQASRLKQETHLNVNGADYVLATEYWIDGSVKRKLLADTSWTGDYTYDLAGRLASIDNANPSSASESDQFIAATNYNARGQTSSITYGNGVTSTYSYNDARGFLTRVLSTNGAVTLLDQNYIRPIYRSQNALRRFKALHSPPIGSPPIVDNPWKKIILEFVSKDRVQFLSIRLIARGEICDDYFTLITFDRVRAVDLEKSDVTRKIEKPGITYVRGMKNIVLKENGLKGLHLARDEQSDHLLVSDELKRALSATGQDSVFYRPEDVITFEKLFATR